MKKITVFVTETRQHKVTLSLPNDEMEELVEDLHGADADDVAGDLCDAFNTVEDGEWELDFFDVIDADGNEI